MASLDKFKEQARKFEQKEQWAKAIEQYVKAVEAFEASPEADDAELGLDNKVGDLYQKIGDTPNAVAYYERAVDKNAEAGLVNQGIALCNKVLRLSPGRVSVYLKLGMLFAKKGFPTEAKQNLLEYADRMQKAGELEAAFAALKKFAEMTPGQNEIWGVLAAQARAAAKSPEQKEQVDRLLAEFEAKDRGEKRKSRMSRSMITGEELPPEPKSTRGELVFLDIDDVPTPGRKSSPAMPAMAAPPPPPPPTPEPVAEIEPLEIESSSLVPEESKPPAAADLPLMDLEPTSFGAEPPAAASSDLGLEPTSFGMEPPALGEPEPVTPMPSPASEPEPATTDELGMLDLDMGEVPAEEPAAEPTAGLPMMGFGDEPVAEVVPSGEATAEPTTELEFLDLGVGDVGAPAAPTLEDLEATVASSPNDWGAHRMLGEAYLERGERERGLSELEAALDGYDAASDFATAAAVVDELLRIDTNSIKFQQKRVELAYKQGDKPRLVEAYVELADALLRSNEADKAIAVYQRVIEHDPSNVRARSALDTLAPPAAQPETPAARKSEAKPPTPAAAPPAGDYVDLGAFLLDEEEGPKDTRMRILDEEPSGDEDKDFQQMLSAFKKGIEANVGEEDFQSHYDLGVAYKEMGLLDEAISEFQKALRAPDGKLKSSEALGLCFFEKGQFAVAETIMRRGLEMPAHDDRERIGLLYWLGRALEEQKKHADALAAYNRVFAVDIRFADIGQRVKALQGAGV